MASSSFSLSLELPQVKICEVYEIALRDGTTYYYTSHSEDKLWNGITYTFLPITRDPINFGINLEMDTVKVYLACISGDLVDYLQANHLDNAEVTITRIQYDATVYSADDELIIFKGHADIAFNRNILELELRPWMDSLNIQAPRRIYQEPCNSSLFDSECGLIQSSFSYSSAATNGNKSLVIDTNRGLVYKVEFDGGGADTVKKGEIITGGDGAGIAQIVNVVYDDAATGRLWYCELTGTQYVNDETLLSAAGGSVVVNGTPEERTDLYERGELRITTGANAGQRRPILSDQSYEIKPFWPFAANVDAGDSYKIYPQCDLRAAETCRSWYGNDDNFSGFLYVPHIEDTMI